MILKYKYSRNGASLLWKSEKNDNLNHPAGIALSEDTLFVVSQNENRIVRFDPVDGSYQKTLLNFGDENVMGENLIYLTSHGCNS